VVQFRLTEVRQQENSPTVYRPAIFVRNVCWRKGTEFIVIAVQGHANLPELVDTPAATLRDGMSIRPNRNAPGQDQNRNEGKEVDWPASPNVFDRALCFSRVGTLNAESADNTITALDRI